jgi:hypothetical protein
MAKLFFAREFPIPQSDNRLLTLSSGFIRYGIIAHAPICSKFSTVLFFLQPSAELFQVFDRMLLLQKGGQTVYFGDLGRNSTTLINYFERNGARVCAADENP